MPLGTLYIIWESMRSSLLSAQDQYQFIYACVSQFINDRASKRLSLSDAAIRKASSQCKFETDMRFPCCRKMFLPPWTSDSSQPTAFQIRRAQQVAGMWTGQWMSMQWTACNLVRSRMMVAVAFIDFYEAVNTDKRAWYKFRVNRMVNRRG